MPNDSGRSQRSRARISDVVFSCGSVITLLIRLQSTSLQASVSAAVSSDVEQLLFLWQPFCPSLRLESPVTAQAPTPEGPIRDRRAAHVSVFSTMNTIPIRTRRIHWIRIACEIRDPIPISCVSFPDPNSSKISCAAQVRLGSTHDGNARASAITSRTAQGLVRSYIAPPWLQVPHRSARPRFRSRKRGALGLS